MKQIFISVPGSRFWLASLALIAPLILLTIILTIPRQASANERDLYGPACGRPVVDGVLQPLEWADAYTQTIQLHSGSSPEPFTATLHVMNTANNLYLGITIDDDEFTTTGQYLPKGDGFRIDFDNDNGSTLFTVDDDVLMVNAGTPQFEDGHILGAQEPSTSGADVDYGGTEDGQGAASRVAELNHFEIQHPLCSGDKRDFCLFTDDKVGFRLEYLDAEGDGSFGGSFHYPGSTETDQADIEIGPCAIPDLYLYLPLALYE